MAIALVNTTSVSQTTNSTTISVNVPSGVVNNNLLILVVTSGSSTNTWTIPTGWTGWGTVLSGRRIFYRYANSEPASYTVTQSTSTSASAYMLAYSGANIDAIGSWSSAASPTVAPAITTGLDNAIVFDFASVSGGGTGNITFSTPTNFTPLVSDSDSSAPSTAIFYRNKLTAGGTGTASSTPSSSTALSIQFSIVPTEGILTIGSVLTLRTIQATTIVPTVPTGVVNGDLMIMIVVVNSTGGTITTPTGWTLWSNLAASKSIYYRIASSEPSSYTVTYSASLTSSASIQVFRNASIDTVSINSSGGQTAGPITTGANNCFVGYHISVRTVSSVTYTAPTGYALIEALTDGDNTAPSSAEYYVMQATAGSTGTVTGTPSTGIQSTGFLFSLKPSSSTPVTNNGNFFFMMGM